ncbi:MAG: DNA mismatch repair protein MutS, partial [Gemmatimonadota bacterium]|nr:DNA mismatch repair protein MutS [Gemmatimonadota bacterium]
MSPDSAASPPPMLKHWREVKAQHPHSILFYRVGDFYEMFHEDAELAARLLDITLTSRGDGVPLAGVPVKAAADYLRQLVAAGHRVAICEQVEDPKLARGLVRREVVETVTPGALLQEGWLAGGRNNWMVAVRRDPRAQGGGLAAVDLSTGEFVLETLDAEGLAEAFSRLNPAEVVVPAGDPAPPLAGPAAPMATVREAWEFDPELAREELARRFTLASLDGLGVGPADAHAIGAAGALLRYLGELQPAGLPHLARPLVRRSEAYLWLDEMTRRNLELVEPLRAGSRGCTLLETIDATVTPMGGRLLRQWLLSPLRDPAAIARRLDAVEVAVRDSRGRAG